MQLTACRVYFTSLLLNHASSSRHIPPPVTPPHFSSFAPVTMDEISKLLSDSPETNCDLDPIPTSLLKQCSSVLLPTITNISCLSQLAFSRISSRIVQFILISRSLVLMRKILQTIVPYLISLIYLNSLKELSKPVSLNIYLITISSTHSSQPTSKVIPLKLLNYLFMTTSSKL